jgi:hypothetical protein
MLLDVSFIIDQKVVLGDTFPISPLTDPFAQRSVLVHVVRKKSARFFPFFSLPGLSIYLERCATKKRE